jgi:hypothetical protein
MDRHRAPPISGSWSPGAARAVDGASLLHGPLRVDRTAETENKLNGWTDRAWTQRQGTSCSRQRSLVGVLLLKAVFTCRGSPSPGSVHLQGSPTPGRVHLQGSSAPGMVHLQGFPAPGSVHLQGFSCSRQGSFAGFSCSRQCSLVGVLLLQAVFTCRVLFSRQGAHAAALLLQRWFTCKGSSAANDSLKGTVTLVFWSKLILSYSLIWALDASPKISLFSASKLFTCRVSFTILDRYLFFVLLQVQYSMLGLVSFCVLRM